MRMKKLEVSLRLKKHVEDLERHFENASDFLTRCQITEPYVREGTLKGSVCPWEIGVADTHGLTILEDFHDTLEAIWVWSYFTRISGRETFKPNIELGWNYITSNYERHIPPGNLSEGLYNCSHVVLCGSSYENVFGDSAYHELLQTAGDRIARHLRREESEKCQSHTTESCWTWWMASCLGSTGRTLENNEWLREAKAFVERALVTEKEFFSSVEKEPPREGPGGHDCFSSNANKALALSHCCPSKDARRMLSHEFLPLIPKRFIERHVDENAWNANVAMALGRSYELTNEEEFLRSYFKIMDELRKRDTAESSALPRSAQFTVRESWVTFFYAYSYASVVADQNVVS